MYSNESNGAPPFCLVVYSLDNKYWFSRYARTYEHACELAQRELRKYIVYIFEFSGLSYDLIWRAEHGDLR